MKKITSSFVVGLFIALFAVSAFAGPIDWVMDKIGYTPTAVYETQVQVATKALEAAKVANAAAASAAETAVFQGKIISYGGIALIALGGLAYFRRKKIAHTIIDEKKDLAPTE